MNQQAIPSGPFAADFAALGVEEVDAVHLHAQPAVQLGEERDVGLAEDDEKVTFAGVLEVLGHVCQGQPNFPQFGNSNFPTRLRIVFGI